MKRIFNTAGNIIGGLIIIGAGIVLALTLKGANSANEQPSTFQSPIEKVVVSAPTATILSSQHISPVATPTLDPMSAKATVAALGMAHKTEVVRPRTPIKSDQDVINAVLNDSLFQKNLSDPLFGPSSKDATPGKPIFVTSLNLEKNDYYLVPFYRDKKVSGIAVVGIEDDTGILGMWANTTYTKFPVVGSEEAKELVSLEGFKVIDTPRLVFRWLREGGDETDPFWEVMTEEGITFYVIHILNETKVYRSDEVHPTD